MFRQGKDLDLSTPRARQWSSSSVSSAPELKSRIRAVSATAPSISAAEPDVLARLNRLGQLQAIGVLAVAAFAAVWLLDGGYTGSMGTAVFLGAGLLIFGRALTGALNSLISLISNNGRAIYVQGDRLRVVSPMSGSRSFRLSEITGVTYDPAHKRGKGRAPAVLLMRAKGAPRPVWLDALDTSHETLAAAIRRAADASRERT